MRHAPTTMIHATRKEEGYNDSINNDDGVSWSFFIEVFCSKFKKEKKK
jgi:hypothetical protein